MNFFRNKYFLLGILLLLAIAIPLTIYFVQRQQDLQSRAAPTSNLTFTPATQSVNVGDEFDLEVSVDPGQNFVSFVQFDATFDPQFIEVTAIEPNINAFPLTLEGPTIGAGSAQIAVGIGADVTQAIQTPTTVATVRLKALAETGSTPTQVNFVTTDTQVLSLSVDDQPGENVLSNATPAQITILAGGDVTPSPSPSVSPSISPTVTKAPTSPTPTQVPTEAPNAAPQCTALTVSPSNSGVAPFAVNFTAEGSDDELVTKATYNFGDGDVQDVFDGLNAASVTSQTSHTYQNQGSYTASVTFTDNQGSISQSCTQIIEVSLGTGGDTGTGSESATTTPLPTKPPIDSPGGVIETVAIAGGVLLAILGGILFFAL